VPLHTGPVPDHSGHGVEYTVLSGRVLFPPKKPDWDDTVEPLSASDVDCTGSSAWAPTLDEEWCRTFMADHPWQPDVSVQDQALEDNAATDCNVADPTDGGARYRAWFKRRSVDPQDFGYLAWRRAVRVREYALRGPRTNAGLQSRRATGTVALYVLSADELLALLYCHRWSPVSQQALDAIKHPTDDVPASRKAFRQRTSLPSRREQMRLAMLPQDSEEWGNQRQLSNGSSGYGIPPGWTYSDVYHLKVQEMRGDFGVPGFDAATRYNFLHGHGREPDIRVAWEIVMGAWAGETGMLLHRDVWRHLPNGRFTTVSSSSSSSRSVGSAELPGADPHTPLPPATTPPSLPEGHKHTSPDGVVVMAHGVYHNRWFAEGLLNGTFSRKGLIEIKAPGYKVMQRRGRNYKQQGWRKRPIEVPHLPVYYYVPQLVDQLDIVGNWGGEQDAQWVDFVPMWTAHGRIGPQPFFYVLELLQARNIQQDHPSMAARWFVATLEARKQGTPQVWVTGEMLVTRVLRNNELTAELARCYYRYHADIHGTHEPPRIHHAKLTGKNEKELQVTYIPMKKVVWVIHATSDVPPVPCVWAQNMYGCVPRPHEVQVVTRALTRHDTTYPTPPNNWPGGISNWPPAAGVPCASGSQPASYHTVETAARPTEDPPIGAYMSCYVIHFWNVKPMQNTLSQMAELK
jgi:hypothetical protein